MAVPVTLCVGECLHGEAGVRSRDFDANVRDRRV